MQSSLKGIKQCNNVDLMPKRKYTKYPSSSKRQVTLIRRIIKKKCPTVSVRMGTGTAYGWADITSRDIGARFTDKEKRCLRNIGLRPGSNYEAIAPDKQKKFIEYHMVKRARIKLTGE